MTAPLQQLSSRSSLSPRHRVAVPVGGRASAVAGRMCRAASPRAEQGVTKGDIGSLGETRSRHGAETPFRGSNMLNAVFSLGAAPRPSDLGVQDFGAGYQSLSLCPPSGSCVASSEDESDRQHYVPPLTYNPSDGRGADAPVSQAQAMAELVGVVQKLRPDGFTPTIVTQTDDYLYVEYKSRILGFIDDVEFWFKPGTDSYVEYRSASRVGESDGNTNRKRIRAIRLALEMKGWRSVGF